MWACIRECICICVCLHADVLFQSVCSPVLPHCIILSNPSGSQEIQSVPQGGVSGTRRRARHTQSSTRLQTTSAKRDGSMKGSGE